MVSIYPWQESHWHRLAHSAGTGQLGHALLFSGRSGVGHALFAHDFAKFLLCEAPRADLMFCDDCRGCQLFDAGNHPDFLSVAPLEEGKVIGVDQIRELPSFYALKAHYGGRKVAIISVAESMNIAASNALLKTLEEPPSGAVMILVTEQYDRLSMTIRSRCQRVAFEHVEQELAIAWLREQLDSPTGIAEALSLSGGAPLTALQYLAEGGSELQEEIMRVWAAVLEGQTNPISLENTFRDHQISAVLNALTQLIYLLILLESGSFDALYTPDSDLKRNLQACANGLNFRDLYAILDVVFEAKRQVRGATNPRDADLLDPIWLMLSDYQGGARRAS